MTDVVEARTGSELLVADIDRSVDVWCRLCGFEVVYSRPDDRFAYIAPGSAHVMLEQAGVGRNWITGSLERPLGRAANFQITVPDVGYIAASLDRAGVDLFMRPESKWYRVDEEEVGVEQFLVVDPNGYILRFQTSLGRRPAVR